MEETKAAVELGRVTLSIPAWQIALYIAISSIFMLFQERKLSLITTYLFTFYWGFFVYGNEFMAVAGGSTIALTLYIFFGLLLVVFALIAFFQEPE